VSGAVAGRRIAVQGIVQGVGFRPWVYHLARRLGVAGSVQNGPEGVTIDAFAPAPVLDELVARLSTAAPPAARVDAIAWTPLAAAAPADFSIVASASAGAPRASIPPDLATCDACAREIRDPAARRYRYPFTNCTHCGPRFSIATGVPYDRPSTTMAGFPLCAECRREYEDPDDRRFHAQPIACPRCGPRLALLAADGVPVNADDPIAAAGALLRRGHIVALRGLGGFHLACLARRDDVVGELRRRKRRDEKPFAVMVRDLAAARALADVDAAAAALLTSPARPIVLVDRSGDGLAASVAPGGRQLGLFLPYTPLHELLLDAVDAPLVMTSGNRSDEPMVVDNQEALSRLRGIADGFLVHDRPIATRTDDSVARIVAGAPMIVRRGRGFVPAPLAVPIPFAAPVLAVGGQLKNTFCLGVGGLATLGPHVGDLDDLATYESFTTMIDRCERFLGVHPEVVAHDLHPGYQSTRYAEERAAEVRIGVQHHHAHVAAVMAEHHLAGPVVGVAYDGTGHGSDGAAWGGEILVAGYASFERVATFRPLPLAGGDRAVHEPWRVALAVLDDAFAGDPPLSDLPLFDAARVAPHDLRAVRQLLATGAGVVRAHGVGRAFDAAAALVLARPRARFEAQLAIALEQVAAPGPASPYPVAIETSATPWQIDLRPTWRSIVRDLGAGVAPARIAARFHEAIAAATVRVVAALRAARGDLPVVLGGGCFQNARLASAIATGLAGAPTYLPRSVPAGDGGLALGQAAVAAARLAASKGGS
jgi:hydrogenase maturation protein HypF